MSGTAEIYDAVLTPGKMELLRAWVSGRPWFDGDAAALEQVTAYRFVDSDGVVGMESFLLTDGQRTFHVPVTYRGEELPDASASLVGTTEHSVLGRRWVYDAEADPVYRAEVRRVILHRDAAADHLSMEDDTITPSPVNIRGGGAGGSTGAGDGALPDPQVVRVVSEENNVEAGLPVIGSPGTLSGTWEDADGRHTAVLVVIGR